MAPTNVRGDKRNELTSTKIAVGDSTSLLLWGAFCFHIMVASIISTILVFFVGALFYPRQIGLLLLVPYYSYTLFIGRAELNDGSPWRWFMHDFPFVHSMREFLGLRLIASKELSEADKKENSQFVLAVFPHGTGAEYRVLMAGLLDSVLPNSAQRTRTLAASVLFRLPLLREICLWTSCVDARRSVAEKLLRRGRSILVIPGGEAEQIRTVCGREIVYLNRRKGFLKIALQCNVPVVPVYVFGASDYYHTSSALFSARLWLVKHFGVCIPFAWGWWGSPICPRPVPTTIVFGKPLHFAVKEAGSPTTEELDAAHFPFHKALVELFDEHKTRLGYGDRSLEIV